MSSTVFPRLSALARAKMHAVFGGKGAKEDNTSLHRWVLLKNSLVASQHSISSCSVSISESCTSCTEVDEEVDSREGEEDVFLFPLLDDAGEAPKPTGSSPSESAWLDSLLETLGDDSDEDDYSPCTPPASPVSSSDDLVTASVASSFARNDTPARSPPFGIPYPVPYPPLFSLTSAVEPASPVPSPVHVYAAYPPPPYPPVVVEVHVSGSGVLVDPADLPVPDAIDDLSDDESDVTAPLTPSSVPRLPALVEAHRATPPRIYVPPTVGYFFDPLPFAEQEIDDDTPHVFGLQAC
jgi:hypothetical protein